MKALIPLVLLSSSVLAFEDGLYSPNCSERCVDQCMTIFKDRISFHEGFCKIKSVKKHGTTSTLKLDCVSEGEGYQDVVELMPKGRELIWVGKTDDYVEVFQRCTN